MKLFSLTFFGFCNSFCCFVEIFKKYRGEKFFAEFILKIIHRKKNGDKNLTEKFYRNSYKNSAKIWRIFLQKF